MKDPEEEDDDVVIEGSDLHRALVSMGYTDFEFAPVEKKNSTPDDSVSRRNVLLARLDNLYESCCRVVGSFRYPPRASRVSSQQLRTILGAKCLLDDHRALVERFMENPSKRLLDVKFTERSIFLISCAMIAIASVTLTRNKAPGMFLATSVGAFGAYREYEDIRAVGALKNLVEVQNESYEAYRRALGILRSLYRSATDGGKARSAFSALDTERLKFLQPLTECFTSGVEKTCRAYHCAASSISNLLPERASTGDARRSATSRAAFAVEGIITYDDLKRFYYEYILAQSDTLQLLAIGYKVDTQRSETERGATPFSLLTRINEKLCASLRRESNRLTRLVLEYDNCKGKRTLRKYRVGAASEWRDLYLNLDLLARKLSSVYDEVVCVIGEIEKRSEVDRTKSGVELAARIHGIYSGIDESRNLAEFNELSIAGILRRGRECAADTIPEVEPYAGRVDRAIERDSEPRIIDEVFEEYATREETEALCEMSEEVAELAKLDGLLAKNFMSELKDALVEKSKSMTEREERALLRKYPSESCHSEECNVQADRTQIAEERDKPTEESSQPTISVRGRITGLRAPVSLSRASNVEKVLQPPPPPPLPSLPAPFPEIESFENKRFFIGLSNLGSGMMPAFVTCEEEFIGSGENSEEEGETRDFAS